MDQFAHLQHVQPPVGAIDPNILALMLQQMQSQQAQAQSMAPPFDPLAQNHGVMPQPLPPLATQLLQPPPLPPFMQQHVATTPPMLHMGGSAASAGPPLRQMPDPRVQQQSGAHAHGAQSPAQPAEKAPECHLHKKLNKNCKRCQRVLEWQASQNQVTPSGASGVGARTPIAGKVVQDPVKAVTVSSFGISPLVQSHILGSAHYKESLTLETFDQIVGEMREYGDSVEPYLPNSQTTPSALFCCLFRLVTFGIDATQLLHLIELDDSPRIRAVAILYIRFGLPPDQLWAWLGDYVLDNQELVISTSSQAKTTIGEFIERLLLEDMYYSIIMPRLPMSVKRQLQNKIAPVSQYRLRAEANLEFLDIYRDGRISVEINIDGKWKEATAQTLAEEHASRVKVVVIVKDDESEQLIPLGKIIVTDRRHAKSSKTGRRDRSRSPGKSDLAREHGQPDQELIDALRSKDRDKATTSGKDYARRPLGYKASCAMKQEMGVNLDRLQQEETFVSDRGQKGGGRRSPSPLEANKPLSAERQRQMQQLFEKYGMSKPTEAKGPQDDGLQPDVMRLG